MTGMERFRPLGAEDRISETLFGLIMVLTFTGSLSVAESGREDVRAMLIGALGCNVAWGVIDGLLFLMGRHAEQRSRDRLVRAVKTAAEPAAAHRAIAGALPEDLAAVVTPEELEPLAGAIRRLPLPPERRRLAGNDYVNAVGVFLWVVVTVLPVSLPFLFVSEPGPALRWSNAVAIAMLFGLGVAYGRVSGHRPWVTGLVMVLLGGALVGLTMALGG